MIKKIISISVIFVLLFTLVANTVCSANDNEEYFEQEMFTPLEIDGINQIYEDNAEDESLKDLENDNYSCDTMCKKSLIEKIKYYKEQLKYYKKKSREADKLIESYEKKETVDFVTDIALIIFRVMLERLF